MKARGYFGIGVYLPKCEMNIGTLWRSAYIYGADFIFTIGRRYRSQTSDTLKSFRHIPLWNFSGYEDFKNHIPYNAEIVCVEIDDKSRTLVNYVHPQQAIYLLGAEDNGLPEEIMFGKQKIFIPSKEPRCLNVAVAGSIVMYDRFIKGNIND